ncbi:DNA-3-methyladenine glycosylase 2 family protein [Nocardioides sp.]|uniref:DNA-3-methyladenine glycosylase family protein n=1 Tax=Nocardioides sp. TaxID=35761 RepID=UPI002BE8E33E|nr:DNA-3-methyladenine glycosylase 2 family protein [Nocardioides sp.]HXH78511.1 DNA-3-methyladenine glycosylase 2 family protein [Nocardioides sp.]
MQEQTRTWEPSWPCAVGRMLRQQRRGARDPSYRIDDATGTHWRGIRTPEGAATLSIRQGPRGEVQAAAWGPGTRWALDSVPSLLGAHDDPSTFEPRHPLLVEASRRHPHVRFGASGLVMQALIPSIIEQKVTGQEAFAGYRALVMRYGDHAPGPAQQLRLWVPPDAATVRMIPSWAWLEMHIDHARSRAIVTAARVAEALERHDGPADLDRRLCSLPGIGAWTSAEVRSRALGDPDAVSFGDYHVAKDVGWAMTGEEFDDRQLAEFLEPWRPQRNRAVVLIMLAKGGRPRHGARMAPRTHLPGRTPGR